MIHQRIHCQRPGAEPIEFDPMATYAQQNEQMKPRGFWYAIGDAWIEWCESEDMNWIGESFYEVDLGRTNMLVLNNPGDLLEFTRQYPFQFPWSTGLDFGYIDWQRVAEKFDGIEIPNYLWGCRLNNQVFWYYGWDCASGCVWNVKNVTLKPTARPAKKEL